MSDTQITAVTPDPRRPGAARVHAAGNRFWTVSHDAVQQLALSPGTTVSASLEAALDLAAEVEGAFRAALRALARRAYARSDLGRRLRQKAHSAPAVEGALEQLDRSGLLDDLRFATSYVETRAVRGRGPMRLRRDLGLMGVSREDIDTALRRTWPEGGPGEETPRLLASRRLARLPRLPRDALRRRLLAFLARRGYTGDTARKAVGEALNSVRRV